MFKRLLSALVISLLANTFLFGQEQSMLDSVHHIGEVVITAKPFQEIIPSQRLAGAQLERLNSHNVADALRYFAGVQIKDYGGMGGIKTINVRNMGTQHVGVFYDGMQVGNAQNGIVDLGRFSLDDMEEISLYNGQRSEIFQSARDYSSSSSIYLRTKRPRFDSNKKTNTLVRYKTGSIDLINPSLRIERKLSNTFNLSLSSEYTKSDGKYKFRYRRKNMDGSLAYDTTATRKNSDIEALRIESALFGTIADGLFEAKLYYYGSERGLPGPILNNVFSHGERQWDKNFVAQAGYSKEITRKYKLKANTKFAYDYTHYTSNDIQNGVQQGTKYNNHYYQQEAYASVVNMYSPTTWWDMSLSTDFQWNKLNASLNPGANFAYPIRNTELVALATAVNFDSFKAQASLLSTFTQEKVRNGNKQPNRQEFTPALFVGYRPFKEHDFNIRAFYKRIFRLPTFNELYYITMVEAKIKPEYTNQYNLGMSYTKELRHPIFRSFSIQADAYFLNVRDKIVATPTNSGFRWSISNMGKVEAKGLDAIASLQLKIEKIGINNSFSYSYSRAKNLSNPLLSSYGHQIPYTPRHSGSYVMNADYETWALNYSFIYIGERYNSENNTPTYRVEPWKTHDISLQKYLKIHKLKIKASAEVNNMFNQYYDVVVNYPMPGRTFKFILNIEL